MSAGWTVANESAAMTLTLYEYLLTFSQEVECIWRRKKSVVSLLYLVNRYSLMAIRGANIVQLVKWGDVDSRAADKICTVASRLSESFSLALYASSAVLVMIRLYVVSNRNVRLIVAITALGITFSVMNIYYFTTLTFHALQPPDTGCKEQTSLHVSGVNIIMAISIFNIVFSVVFESIVIAFTCANTLNVIRLMRTTNPRNHKGVSYLILRDGSVYFMTLNLMNILSLLALRVKLMSNSATYVDTLSSILISRFILNLRDDSSNGPNRDPDRTSLHMSHMTDLRFVHASRVVGNLGQSLCFEDVSGVEGEVDG